MQPEVLRRTPVQARSAERVQRMLDACGALIGEVGYEHVTTTLIARRAQVAIGSLYQFFPDKPAVAGALVDRNVDRYLTALAAALRDAPPQLPWEAVDAAIEVYVQLHHADPGFRALHFGDVVDTQLLHPGQDNNAVIADRLGDLLREQFDLPESRRVALSLTIAVEIADAMLKLAFRQGAENEAAIVSEAKDVVRGYLAQRLPA